MQTDSSQQNNGDWILTSSKLFALISDRFGLPAIALVFLWFILLLLVTVRKFAASKLLGSLVWVFAVESLVPNSPAFYSRDDSSKTGASKI